MTRGWGVRQHEQWVQRATCAPLCLEITLGAPRTPGIKFYDPEIVGDTPEAVEKVWVGEEGAGRPSHMGVGPGHVHSGVRHMCMCREPLTSTHRHVHSQIGVENVLAQAAQRLGVVGGTPLLRPTAELAARWGALDDGACVGS